jgi:hypothetical protein
LYLLEDVFGEKRGVTEVTGVVDMKGSKGMKNAGRKEKRVSLQCRLH